MSLIALNTVVILLTHILNGRRPPAWHLGKLEITANALVSLATEFAKMSMTASVVNLLAQFKWLRLFEQPSQPLMSLQVHHDATQGPWGSMMLLLKKERRYNSLRRSIQLIEAVV